MPSLSATLRPLLAALVMGMVVLAVGAERSLMLTLPVGVVSYAAALVLLGGVPGDARTMYRS